MMNTPNFLSRDLGVTPTRANGQNRFPSSWKVLEQRQIVSTDVGVTPKHGSRLPSSGKFRNCSGDLRVTRDPLTRKIMARIVPHHPGKFRSRGESPNFGTRRSALFSPVFPFQMRSLCQVPMLMRGSGVPWQSSLIFSFQIEIFTKINGSDRLGNNFAHQLFAWSSSNLQILATDLEDHLIRFSGR